MKADPTAQWRLLDLQALDTRTGQIEHRLAKLPEEADHAALVLEREAMATDLLQARTELGDVQRDLDKAEADVQLVRDRAARNQSRLDSGQGTPKDLQALQHELESLGRRQSELEDEQLAVMERAEGLTEQVSTLTVALAEVDDKVAAAAVARDAAVATLRDEAEALARTRAGVVAGVGEALVAHYEKIRARTGMGAAEVTQRRCTGCNLELVGADLARIAKAEPDEVLQCEECRRILVRTADSGL